MKHSGDKENGGRKKKRWPLLILAGLILVVALVAGWLWVTQGNNLKALYLAMKNDQGTLEQMQQEQDKKRDELLEEYGLTKPDSVQTGGETDPPAAETTPAQPDQTGQTEQGTGGASSSPSDGQSELQQQLQQKVNQLYNVEAQYRGILNDVVAQAKQEFWNLPKDQRTQSNKMSIVKSKASMLIEQESQCDAQVNAILDDIREILRQMGKSTDLADQISSYYEESKANWKAAKMTELYS